MLPALATIAALIDATRSVASRILDRVRREPALLVTAVVAVLNLAGADPETVDQAAKAVETVSLLVIGLVARSQYTPLANRQGDEH